ncbi:MAG: M12 family metallo-peptidase [Alphaproteobacteria bacterium]
MRRRITCSILSAFLFASCVLFENEPALHIIRVKALADPSFRARNPRWEEELRGRVEAASDYFEREFAIRLVTQSVAPWPAQERLRSTPALIAKLKKDFPADKKNRSYDLIIAFTAEGLSRYTVDGRPRVDHIGDCAQGLGNYVVTSAGKIFHYTGAQGDPDYDTVTLVHELGHIFGAEHVPDTRSIMNENFDYRADFDMKNRSVILKNRNCPFARGKME